MNLRYSLVLVVSCLIVFGSVALNGFLQYDDYMFIVDNVWINQPSWDHAWRYWTTPLFAIYAPVAFSAGGVLIKAFGLVPAPFHLLSLFLHVGSALVVFRLLAHFTKSGPAALVGALVFALHPVQVEPIGLASETKDLCFGFFALLSLWQYQLFLAADQATRALQKAHAGRDARRLSFKDQQALTGAQGASRRHYWVATAACVLAVLSKPTGVIVPFAAVLVNRFLNQLSWKESARGLIPWFAVAIPFLIWTASYQTAAALYFIPPLWVRPLIALDSTAFYLYKIVNPFFVNTDYGRTPAAVIASGEVYVTWVAPLLVLALAWFNRQRHPALFGCLLLFGVGFLPVSGLAPFHFQNVSTTSDHYLYFSMTAVSLLVAFGWARVEEGTRPTWVLPVASIILLAFAAKSAHRMTEYRDNDSFFTAIIRLNPKSVMAYNNLGLTYQKARKFDAALAAFRKALEINPDYMAAEMNLGQILIDQGKPDEALTYFSKIVEREKDLDPARPGYEVRALRFGQIRFGIALMYCSRGEAGPCKVNLERSIELSPRVPAAYNQLGLIYRWEGNLPKAQELFSAAVRLEPSSQEYRTNLASVSR